MTLHKLNITFQQESYSLVDTVVNSRALQALEVATTNHPIHRTLRCAARGKLERLFDDLALKSGLIAQRLEEGTLLLEGPGVFVHADGKMKSEYSSCCFSIWAATPARVEEIGAQLFARDGISSTSFEEIACEVLHDEAYPDLGEPVMDFITRYLDGQETVLILLGSLGRCFATLHTRSLTPTEGSRLIGRLCGGDSGRAQAAFARTFPPGAKTCSVASIYRACCGASA